MMKMVLILLINLVSFSTSYGYSGTKITSITPFGLTSVQKTEVSFPVTLGNGKRVEAKLSGPLLAKYRPIFDNKVFDNDDAQLIVSYIENSYCNRTIEMPESLRISIANRYVIKIPSDSYKVEKMKFFVSYTTSNGVEEGVEVICK